MVDLHHLRAHLPRTLHICYRFLCTLEPRVGLRRVFLENYDKVGIPVLEDERFYMQRRGIDSILPMLEL